MTTTPDLVRSRRAFDRTVLEAMVGPNLQVRAFSNAADLASGKGLDMGDGREARAYRVTNHQRTLTGPDVWAPTTVVAINAEVPNYPVGEPMVWAESRPVPWSPHWSPTSGQFCMGPFWGIGKGGAQFSGHQTWAYDSLGRMTSSMDGTGATVGYGYDLRNNLTTVACPGEGTSPGTSRPLRWTR